MMTNEISGRLIGNLKQVIKGKDDVIKLFVTAFLAGGHILIEDVPGTGKTTLVKALAQSIEENPNVASFKRIQCTPDLLPYDITGVEVFNQSLNKFEFQPGPVFCTVLLADELNRTPPKVQSALLEVMAEHQVTSGRQTYDLGQTFFVAATQNPVETLGVYPLPAAQLDRFMFFISVGYPSVEAELEILDGNPSELILPTLQPVISNDDVLACRAEMNSVFVHPALKKAIVEICNKTRNHNAIELGASPRAGLQFLKAVKMWALLSGRTWVEDIDLKAVGKYLLSHRIVFSERNNNAFAFIDSLIDEVLARMERIEKWADFNNADSILG